MEQILVQAAELVIGLLVLGLVTWLVARTSRRVLGIQVSTLRALLVSLIVWQGLVSVVTWLIDVDQFVVAAPANVVTLVVVGLATMLGAFALGLLVLMVLEVVVPTGSLPPLRVLLTGWR